MNAMQMDWVGEAPKKPKAQITIPDKRPLIAARKAELALQIGSASGEPRGCVAGQRAGCSRMACGGRGRQEGGGFAHLIGGGV